MIEHRPPVYVFLSYTVTAYPASARRAAAATPPAPAPESGQSCIAWSIPCSPITTAVLPLRFSAILSIAVYRVRVRSHECRLVKEYIIVKCCKICRGRIVMMNGRVNLMDVIIIMSHVMTRMLERFRVPQHINPVAMAQRVPLPRPDYKILESWLIYGEYGCLTLHYA